MHGKHGERIGFKIPEHERRRWDNPIKAPPPAPPGTEAASLELIVKQLNPHLDLDVALRRRLEYAYELDDLRVTRITSSIVRETENGRLNGPGGLLWKRLGEVIDAKDD